MEGFRQQEKVIDPFLEELWNEYGFEGKPPFANSLVEKRLKEACDAYANYMENDELPSPTKQGSVGKSVLRNSDISEGRRRKLHNEIALMLCNRQRTNMSPSQALNIAKFAFEYSRGYKFGERDKFKRVGE